MPAVGPSPHDAFTPHPLYIGRTSPPHLHGGAHRLVTIPCSSSTLASPHHLPSILVAPPLPTARLLQVISMVGRIASRFRRAASFELGPLRIQRPLFMELPCSGEGQHRAALGSAQGAACSVSLLARGGAGGPCRAQRASSVRRRCVLQLSNGSCQRAQRELAPLASLNSPAALCRRPGQRRSRGRPRCGHCGVSHSCAAQGPGRCLERSRGALCLELAPRLPPAELHLHGLVCAQHFTSRSPAHQPCSYDVLRRAVVHMPPHPRRPTLPPTTVDSPAAAVAARASAAQLRSGPLPFTLRLEHPAALEPSAALQQAELAVAPPSSSGGASSGQAVGSATATAAAAAAGSGAAAVPLPAPSSNSSRDSSPASASSGLRIAASTSPCSLQGPAGPAPPAQQRQHHPEWLPLVIVSSLPHVELELLLPGGRRHRGLFMIDSGGCYSIAGCRCRGGSRACPRCGRLPTLHLPVSPPSQPAHYSRCPQAPEASISSSAQGELS